jgi:hypothetical protein
MSTRSAILAILGVAALAAAAPAAAQDRGLYLGGSVGLVQYKDTCDDLQALGATACDREDAAYRVFAGYSFSRYFAVETAYVNLGNVTAAAGGALFDADTHGMDLAAVLTARLFDRLSAFGKLGLYRLRTTIEAAGGRSGETDSGLTYGLGLGYDLGRLGIRFEWTRYDNIRAIAGEDSADVLGVGALFRF